MKDELSLEKLVSDIILFLFRNKFLIISITLFGIFSVVLFQKLKPSYFSTNAIASSGIAAYERFKDEDILNQRTAINMISNIQMHVKKEDYTLLSNKLNISLEAANNIKFIKAEQIFREDKDDKKHNTPKFNITLLIRDNKFINEIQQGIVFYFNTNKYIIQYKQIFNETNQIIMNSIDQEILEFRELRRKTNARIDLSTNTILSSRDDMDIQNQIVDLTNKKAIIMTNDKMLQPITFVEGFSVTNIAERDIFIWGVLIGVVSFFLAVIVAIVQEVLTKALRNDIL